MGMVLGTSSPPPSHSRLTQFPLQVSVLLMLWRVISILTSAGD